ncbi:MULTISPECIES: TIGR04211 family SH3 domain-containing protein [unclassified Colwellia]|uniref:TIGR04211 family SH3 domain-containing protein n=1 Tax=unclassified Colwellia TaxID=196834 RepID=UPI0015F3628F|nr:MULTISPECIES: TIGR04211 family SH3 domain-containing protein [unclassified Colwellia]MBA6233466.1 TIGR04211 family SH3 domain-containing protein [Colwellia sp. MB02u-7]MBA6236556.1 TIGR04211 family SH3 domain-containing protein [Colwellia sp. MB02u-11]MBA6257090.1 TIGR04211 family SH3 domain-containing protein [Colwellia sp. MB3u-28]MBA6260905.1 TIGR04211 family SH3 domain-containing protein [Colwellia sp. MB3u-41]MBA6298045.1 TIGR04211 family SH3 domain-containing protein [Colwellia sp. MB
MKIIKALLVGLALSLSFSLLAEDAASNLDSGYISDDLFIYMHSGAGNNYRILGSINSGTEVKVTGQYENDYTEIVDDKNRNVWVESKYISLKPGLRFVIAELNERLANTTSNTDSMSEELAQAKDTIENLSSEKAQLNNEISQLNKTLMVTRSKLKDQDTNIKKEWFFNGAIVLVIGLLLGLILPRLAARRKGSMDNWK